jgi:hypothetical protein
VVCALTDPQRTSIGHDPVVVFVPTVQDQVALPLESVVFGPSPWAVLGPLLYRTVIEQSALAAVWMVACPVPPRDTGERTLEIVRPSAGIGVRGLCVFPEDDSVGVAGLGARPVDGAVVGSSGAAAPGRGI